jgi:hypothetical protein
LRNLIKSIIGLIIVLGIIVLGSILFESYLSDDEVKVKVIKKEASYDEEGNLTYLIFTEDEIFINVNNNYHGKNNAEKLFKRIRKGRTYSFRVVGYSFRKMLPYLPEYRNIIDIIDEGDKTRKLKTY